MEFINEFINQVLSWCNYIFQFAYTSLISYTINKQYIEFSNSHTSVHYIDSNIGEGAYSTVVKGIDSSNNNQSYAIKKVLLQSKELENIANIEIETYQRFQHNNILRLLDVTQQFDNSTGILTMYLLFPYIKRGSLRDVLSISLQESYKHYRSKQSLPFILRQFISICEAINVLHNSTPSYVHQDIKPENILIDEDDVPYLIDFGSVRKADVLIQNRKDALQIVEISSQYCTAPYRAPELYNPPSTGTKLDARTDVWSIGCLLFAWWFGYSPFECEFVGDDEIKVVECSTTRILSAIPRPKNCSKDDLLIIQIVEWILERDYHQRPYTYDIIEKVTSMPEYKLKSIFSNNDNVV